MRRCSGFAFTQVSTDDLDVAVIGQLRAMHLPLGNDFEPGPVKMVGFQAPFRCRSLIEQGLEHAPTDTHDTSSTAIQQTFALEHSPAISRHLRRHSAQMARCRQIA
jgi:hypothetical protein